MFRILVFFITFLCSSVLSAQEVVHNDAKNEDKGLQKMVTIIKPPLKKHKSQLIRNVKILPAKKEEGLYNYARSSKRKKGLIFLL